MFAFVYRFTVHPGAEARFIAAWHRFTERIRDERGSLGSRLHRAAGGELIAYARWPSREVARAEVATSDAYRAAGAEMRACLVSSEVLYELDIVDDLLV
jgi:quinol monooxygenase YgiN